MFKFIKHFIHPHPDQIVANGLLETQTMLLEAEAKVEEWTSARDMYLLRLKRLNKAKPLAKE